MGTFGNELERRAEIGPQRFNLALYHGDGGQSVGEIWLCSGMRKRNAEINLAVGNSRHHIDEEPFAQTCQGIRWETCEAKPGASRIIRPDHVASGVDLFRAIGEIEAQINRLCGIKRRVALDRNSVFADVHHFVEIKSRALGFLRKTGVSRSLDLVSHTLATVGDRGS